MADLDATGDSVSRPEGQPGAPVDAVIYVAGLSLGLSEDPRSFDSVAERIRDGCNRQCKDRTQKFGLEATPFDLRDGVSAQSQMTLTVASGQGVPRPHADLFEFVWSDELIERWERQGRREKLAKSVYGFAVGVAIFLKATLAAVLQVSGRRFAQAFVALLAVLVVAAYVVGLVVAAATVVIDWFAGAAEWSRWLQQVVVVSTAVVGILVPRLRTKVPGLGAALLAGNNYLTDQTQARRVAGELVDLVDAIAASGRYRNIHVVGYSMGGIVAFDAFFPAASAPVRSVSSVATLVTIGPPFEPVSAARPRYFDRRHAGPAPAVWINYWAEADVISSAAPRVRSDLDEAGLDLDRLEALAYGLTTHLGIRGLLTFAGLTSHGKYWGAGGDRDLNLFDQIVTKLDLDTVAATTRPSRRPREPMVEHRVG